MQPSVFSLAYLPPPRSEWVIKCPKPLHWVPQVPSLGSINNMLGLLQPWDWTPGYYFRLIHFIFPSSSASSLIYQIMYKYKQEKSKDMVALNLKTIHFKRKTILFYSLELDGSYGWLFTHTYTHTQTHKVQCLPCLYDLMATLMLIFKYSAMCFIHKYTIQLWPSQPSLVILGLELFLSNMELSQNLLCETKNHI